MVTLGGGGGTIERISICRFWLSLSDRSGVSFRGRSDGSKFKECWSEFFTRR
jgi:hypothetical protein